MYFTKYTNNFNRVLVGTLYCVLIIFASLSIMSEFLFGLVYLYQSFISLLYSFTYLVLCLNFDNEILNICEKIGFIVRSSRKYKFYLLFLCIGLFILSLLIMSTQESNWQEQQTWIINASKNELAC